MKPGRSGGRRPGGPTGRWAGGEDPAGLTYRLRAQAARKPGEADVSLSSGAADLPGRRPSAAEGVKGAPEEARMAGAGRGGPQALGKVA